MKNKGFTLVEVLTVISIIAVITLLISRPVTALLKEMDRKACDSQNENVLKAAELWFNDNKTTFPIEIGQSETITVQWLFFSGHLDKDIKNVITEQPINKDTEIIITRETAKHYTFTLPKKICEY